MNERVRLEDFNTVPSDEPTDENCESIARRSFSRPAPCAGLSPE